MREPERVDSWKLGILNQADYRRFISGYWSRPNSSQNLRKAADSREELIEYGKPNRFLHRITTFDIYTSRGER